MHEWFMLWIGSISNFYNALEMLILNDSFTEIYFYDLYDMRKIHVRNNARIFKVCYLIFLKYVLRINIRHRISLETVKLPARLPGYGIVELVYYNNKEETRFYTKSEELDRNTILTYLQAKIHKKFLYATISDKLDVTWFINEHISSFNRSNNICVDELLSILTINRAKVPDVDINGLYIKVIDDDTIEETIFHKQNPIVLVE
jgi:hypothetical protein